MRSLLLLLACLFTLPALAGEKKVVILFQGDNGGEVAPCG